MGKPDFEALEVYKLTESWANEIWKIVKKWDYFTKDRIGKQIVMSADSVCDNMAEARVRYIDRDSRRCVKIARGSLYETVNWLT
ncbi:four helix bundle protein [Microcoleus sp. F4-D5]|uniref:four helix bundle protein n=1 Tax=Microcoleus sp. F4-D5 TaxID=2818760 RepID=UPI002FCEA2C7